MPDWMHHCFPVVICGSHGSSSSGRWKSVHPLTDLCCSCVVYECWVIALSVHLRSLMFFEHKDHTWCCTQAPYQACTLILFLFNPLPPSAHAMSYALLMLISFNYPLHQSFSSAISHWATCLWGSPGQHPVGKLNLFPDLQACSVIAAQRRGKTAGVWSQQ